MSPVAHAPVHRSDSADVVTYRQIDRDASALAAMEPELGLDSLVFNWVSDHVRDAEAIGAITGITVERTIEGASTVEVTLQDPDNRLFAGSRVWEPKLQRDKHGRPQYEYDNYGHRVTRPDERGRQMEIKIGGIVFRLVKVSRNGSQMTLTFEDRVIYLLRRKHGAKRAKRSKVTRAQFILSLLREIGSERVRFVCPELNLRQPIDKARTTRTRALVRASTTSETTGSGGNKNSRGIAGNTHLTVKGHRATKEQRRIGQRVLAVADQLNANAKATLALMEAAIVESEVQNLSHGLGGSLGVLQILPMHGPPSKRMDVEWSVRKFLVDGFTGAGGAMAIAKRNPGMSAGTVAQTVQGSSYGDRYGRYQAEASAWVAAYAGSGADISEAGAAGGATRYKSYQFAREGDEDSWTCIQRLASEVGWRAYMQGRSLFYMSEADLYRRMPLYVLKPDDPAVLSFDYDIDWGKTVSEASVQINAGEWQVPPGEPVLVEGWGPPDGRWLVTSWRRDYFSPIVDITLRQPAREKMEPHAETAPSPSSGGLSDEGTGLFSGDVSGNVPKAVVRAYNRADAIDRKNYHYVFGGGHGSFNGPYDCSGFVSSCLHAAGLLNTPEATGQLIGWGESGPGRFMTVWVKENGNPHQSHTFIVFRLKGKTRYAEAGGGNSSHTGWHSPRSHAGFQPRHYPGT